MCCCVNIVVGISCISHSFSFCYAKVLEKYRLKEFLPLVEGIRKGDLRTFNDGLVQYQDLFIRYVILPGSSV